MTNLRQIAYNAGLEVRYEVAASGLDPIQHIPEVDAIIERRLAECRREALEEAAKIAENEGNSCDDDYPGETWIAGQIAAAIRFLSESAPNPFLEQTANIGKEREP